MKKTIIALLLGILMVLPFAFATANVFDTGRVLYSNEDSTPYQLVLINYSPFAWGEVVVCTDSNKNPGNTVVIADLKTGSTANYRQIAADLFASMKPAGGYDHFGCSRVRV